jgi:hypothetical protein
LPATRLLPPNVAWRAARNLSDCRQHPRWRTATVSILERLDRWPRSVGHHLNGKLGLISRNEAASANTWGRKLWRAHCRKRYWFLTPVFRLVIAIASRLARFARGRAAAQTCTQRRRNNVNEMAPHGSWEGRRCHSRALLREPAMQELEEYR